MGGCLQSMTFIHYLKDKNIHRIDYSGIITFEQGLSRMKAAADYFHNLSLSQEQIKVLYDVRKVEWASIEIHNELSKVFRNEIGQQFFFKKL